MEASATLSSLTLVNPPKQVPPSRPLLFFHLGLSLAKLLDVPPSLPSSLPPSSQLFEGGGDGRRQQEEREEEEKACVALLRALAQIFEVSCGEGREGGKEEEQITSFSPPRSISRTLHLLHSSFLLYLPPSLPSLLFLRKWSTIPPAGPCKG